MNEKNIKEKSAFSYLAEWTAPYKNKYIASVLFAICEVVMGLIPFYAVGKIIEALLQKTSFSFQAYGIWLLVSCLSFIMHYIFHAISTSISHKYTFQVIAEVRKEMCLKLSRMSIGKISEKSSGEIKNTIVERVDSIEPTLAHLVPEMTSKLTAPIAIFIYVLCLDWRIALISLITLPIGLVLFMGMRIGYEKKFKRYVESGKNLNTVAVEYINGIEVIKTFNQSAGSYKKFSDAAYESVNSAVDWMKDTQIFFSLGMAVIPSVLVAVLPSSIAFYVGGSMDLSTFCMIIILCFGMIAPLIGALSYNDDIAKIGTIVGEINSILQEDELIRPTKEVNISDYTIKGEDIHFAYNDSEVLHGVSFVFEQGTVNALVGPSGSGKSTIAKLIASMWEVGSGTITIGNKNIKEIPLEQLNRMIAYVSQDNFLFDMNVRDNIRQGNLSATDKEVEEIAKSSGCHDFIMELTNGYDTIVGTSGGHLSGGERQRIAIARAMLKNAPIIILDEATAYTDPENEAVIQQAVSELVKEKTLIVVAHRLSTITDSDSIIVIGSGNVKAVGTHEELLESSDLYKELWQAHIGAKDGMEVKENV